MGKTFFSQCQQLHWKKKFSVLILNEISFEIYCVFMVEISPSYSFEFYCNLMAIIKGPFQVKEVLTYALSKITC